MHIIYTYIYIYDLRERVGGILLPRSGRRGRRAQQQKQRYASRLSGVHKLSGWRNTVEIVLFDISNSLKPYPPCFLAYTSRLKPVLGFSEQKQLIEVSNRIRPTSHLWNHSGCCSCPSEIIRSRSECTAACQTWVKGLLVEWGRDTPWHSYNLFYG